jgi:hypothetical protein
MRYTLTLKNGLTVEIDPALILCNDVVLPRSIDCEAYNPHHVRLWCIGHTFGAVCAVWASEHEALDVAVDGNMMDCFMAEDQDHDDENLTVLGNASELFDLSDVWLEQVVLDPVRDIQLIVALVRASENGRDTL